VIVVLSIVVIVIVVLSIVVMRACGIACSEAMALHRSGNGLDAIHRLAERYASGEGYGEGYGENDGEGEGEGEGDGDGDHGEVLMPPHPSLHHDVLDVLRVDMAGELLDAALSGSAHHGFGGGRVQSADDALSRLARPATEAERASVRSGVMGVVRQGSSAARALSLAGGTSAAAELSRALEFTRRVSEAEGGVEVAGADGDGGEEDGGGLGGGDRRAGGVVAPSLLRLSSAELGALDEMDRHVALLRALSSRTSLDGVDSLSLTRELLAARDALRSTSLGVGVGAGAAGSGGGSGAGGGGGGGGSGNSGRSVWISKTAGAVSERVTLHGTSPASLSSTMMDFFGLPLAAILSPSRAQTADSVLELRFGTAVSADGGTVPLASSLTSAAAGVPMAVDPSVGAASVAPSSDDAAVLPVGAGVLDAIAATLPRLFSHATVASTADAGAALDGAASCSDSEDVDFRDVLVLLRALFDVTTSAAASGGPRRQCALPQAEWLNARLSRQFQQTLRRPAEVLVPPRWLADVGSSCPFLLPAAARMSFVTLRAFGVPHCLRQLHETARAAEEALRRASRRDVTAAAGEPDPRFVVQRRRVVVSRARVLESAMKLMQDPEALKAAVVMVQVRGVSSGGRVVPCVVLCGSHEKRFGVSM
jgi:hypothetical protein